MKPHVRAAMAAAAIAHNGNRKVSSIYDYSKGGYRSIDASASGGRIDGYDYDRSCYFDGNMPSLYHYGESCHLDLKVKGEGTYDGYDYGSSCFFEVKVRGNEAEIYDYGDSGFFSYSV